MEMKRRQIAQSHGIDTSKGIKATPHQEILNLKEEAIERKRLLMTFAKSHNYTSFESVRKLLDIYDE